MNKLYQERSDLTLFLDESYIHYAFSRSSHSIGESWAIARPLEGPLERFSGLGPWLTLV